MTSARDEVLARIRTALHDRPEAPPPPRDYRRTGEQAPGSPGLLDLLEDRLVDYRATVQRCEPSGTPTTVRRVLDRLVGPGARVVVPRGLPFDLAGEVTVDDGTLAATDLDRCAAVVSTCAAACALTGTIALDGSAGQGRRAITLVPDVHVCVVAAEQVVASVPELLARLDPTRPLTLVSGPSATSDIELARVEGVHGPRTLAVVLVTG